MPTAAKLFSRNGFREFDLPSGIEEEFEKDTTNTSKVGDKLIVVSNETKPNNYDMEGKILRQKILEKIGLLQTVLATALEVSRERRDIISRRIIDQTNFRLEQAKERTDRILSEVRQFSNILALLWSLLHHLPI